MAERNAWREVHESMHGGMYLKKALEKVQNNSLFWMREVYERVISERAKGKSKKGKDKKGSWGYPIRQPLWEKKGKGHGDKGGKGKGKGKSKPSDWPSNWAFKNPKGGSLLPRLFHQEDLPRPVWPFSQLSSGELRRMGLQCGTKGAQARELPSQGLKGSDGCQWRCGGRVRLVLIFFLLIPFLFKQWWSGSGGPGRSQRVTTPHCSCGTTQTSRAWGAPPKDSVLEPELDTPQSQVKGGWLLLVCHFLDALQT